MNWPNTIAAPGPEFDYHTVEADEIKLLLGNFIATVREGRDPKESTAPRIKHWSPGSFQSLGFALLCCSYPHSEEIALGDDDPKKGNIALVITRNKTKLRLVSDSKAWRKKRGRPGRKRTYIPQSLSGSGSDTNHHGGRSPTPQVVKQAKTTVRNPPTPSSDNEEPDNDLVATSPPPHQQIGARSSSNLQAHKHHTAGSPNRRPDSTQAGTTPGTSFPVIKATTDTSSGASSRGFAREGGSAMMKMTD